MIQWRLSLRRAVLALVAIFVALPIVRPAISSALVSRGDALLYARDAAAKSKYRLALALDSSNAVAADRYVFVSFLSRDVKDLEDGARVASLVLAREPNDAELRMDRALCLQVLKRYAAAGADFEQAGKLRGDVQALTLGAADAKKSHNAARAHRLLLFALRIDPHYVPALRALGRVRRE